MESPNTSPREIFRKDSSFERLETSPTDQRLENRGYLIYLTIIGSLGGVLLGYDLTLIGVVSLYMYDGDPIENPGDSIVALVASVALIGCAIGTISGGAMGDKYGRKKTIMIADLFMIIGDALLTSAMHIGMLFTGRFIVGLGIGMLCINCPNYLSEAAPDSHRGLISGSNVFFITAAQILVPIIGVLCQEQWRFMFVVGLIFSVAQLIGFMFLPESPKWLFRMHREKEAEEALARIRLPKHKRDISLLQQEINAIKLSTDNYNEEPYFTQLKSIFTSNRKQLKIGVFLQVFQQLTGINIAIYYGPTIVNESVARGDKVLGMLLTLPIYVSNAIGSGIGVKIIDKAGRKSLLLWTIPGYIASLAFLCILFGIRIEDNSFTISILIVIAVIIIAGIFGLALGPIPWVINSEIYPTQYTSVASSVAATSNWVTNAIITFVYGSINTIPICTVLVWVVAATLTTIFWFFAYLVLPETKGKSQAEIQALFRDK
jgi:SP family galactose:H+ symporter-like MFS transporter